MISDFGSQVSGVETHAALSLGQNVRCTLPHPRSIRGRSAILLLDFHLHKQQEPCLSAYSCGGWIHVCWTLQVQGIIRSQNQQRKRGSKDDFSSSSSSSIFLTLLNVAATFQPISLSSLPLRLGVDSGRRHTANDRRVFFPD